MALKIIVCCEAAISILYSCELISKYWPIIQKYADFYNFREQLYGQWKIFACHPFKRSLFVMCHLIIFGLNSIIYWFAITYEPVACRRLWIARSNAENNEDNMIIGKGVQEPLKCKISKRFMVTETAEMRTPYKMFDGNWTQTLGSPNAAIA